MLALAGDEVEEEVEEAQQEALAAEAPTRRQPARRRPAAGPPAPAQARPNLDASKHQVNENLCRLYVGDVHLISPKKIVARINCRQLESRIALCALSGRATTSLHNPISGLNSKLAMDLATGVVLHAPVNATWH